MTEPRKFPVTDPNDQMLLKIASGSIFNSTTLPSGLKTPDYDMKVINGELVEVIGGQDND